MIKLLVVWVLNAVALMAVTYLVPGIHVANFTAALVAALVIGLVNVLILLTLPITLLTLGLFILVINGLLFWAVGNYLQGFSVSSILIGVIGALVYSVISGVLSAIVVDGKD